MTKVNKDNKLTRTEVKDKAKAELLKAMVKAINGHVILNNNDKVIQLEMKMQARRMMEFMGFAEFAGL